MTEAQCPDSSQRSRSSARQLLSNSEHDALVETATMSSYGLSEFPSIISGLNRQFSILRTEASVVGIKHAQTQTSESLPLSPSSNDYHNSVDNGHDEQRDKGSGTTLQRIRFGEFAEQLRQQQYFDNRKTLLQKRIKVLQKTTTLSARLHRVGLWVGDGLVEISDKSDTVGFARVHQHFQNLTDLSYSQWDRELHAIDPLGRSQISNSEAAGSSNFPSSVSGTVKDDFLELISYLRSNPRFLAERLRLLTSSQIASLWNVPKSQRRRNAADTQYPRGSRDQLNRQLSKSLEEYAASLERLNPLSFLLFNIYGTDQSSVDAENQLRLSTWSEVCAELMLTSKQAYMSLVIHLLDNFASLYEWRARDSVEFFLMGILQRGSFLLNSPDGPTTRRSSSYNPSATSEAREFFDTAVRDLFELLLNCDGGFPVGALQLAAAVLDKLPAVQQAEFRGTFFFSWFIKRFLYLAINYPENENMLLKFHISGGARKRILNELYCAVHDHVQDTLSQPPDPLMDSDLQTYIRDMVGCVDSAQSGDPYKQPDKASTQDEEHSEASITISVSEIVQVLEAIAPQKKIEGVWSVEQLLQRPPAASTFHGQYTFASHRFDSLKNVLISSSEPGSSATIVHPCQEQWLQITIDSAGRPKLPQKLLQDAESLQSIGPGDLDSAQKGALRLFKDYISDSASIDSASYRNDLLKSQSLKKLFGEMAAYTLAKHDPVSYNYWNDALDALREKYPLSMLVEDDSAVFRTAFMASKDAQIKCREYCLKLELQLSIMEDICLKIRSSIDKSIDGFESLRLKLWYSTDVVGSKVYESAKYVTKALNHMAIPTSMSTGNHHSGSKSSFLTGRPMSPRSVASWTFEQPYEAIMNVMKAPAEQGGPKKLSDKQIELTNNWLAHTQIEKFCEGEERIHRFCMEIHNVAKNLVGETLSQSPVLWASGLFAREQSLFNTNYFRSASEPSSTRPASISSSVGYFPSSSIQRSTESLRMVLEERKLGGTAGDRRNVLPPELAASIRSLSKAHSATTAGSNSSVFSRLPSYSRSLTSASVYSKSPSMFNDLDLSRFEDTNREKAKFLERVQQVLICLLLSDLGCPVWTMGSETDAMLKTFREMPAVSARLQQRMLADSLADRARRGRSQQQGSGTRPRSQSMSTQVNGPQASISETVPQVSSPDMSHLDDDHQADLWKLLTKLGQQVDPIEKIAIVKEFYALSLRALWCRSLSVNDVTDNVRRSSLDEQILRSHLQEPKEAESSPAFQKRDIHFYSEHEIIQHLKSDLAKLCPTTLFRDLQYISAFVPADCIDNGPQDKALAHVGLAAFAYKDELCRSMVDVADKIVTQIQDPTSQPELMQQVANLWIFAAREGNAVAQRELALLYLSQPTLLPAISLPLSRPSQIFRTDISWHERRQPNPNTAMCLALHWLKEASKKGDRVAMWKLDEGRRWTKEQ